jgi:hypothetical protein
VDLKPINIFVTGENQFKIADLGFIALSSLKYSSLPDKYRSDYTAPEIQDAFSMLNTTMDVYALGLVLYQVFATAPVVGISASAGKGFGFVIVLDALIQYLS